MTGTDAPEVAAALYEIRERIAAGSRLAAVFYEEVDGERLLHYVLANDGGLSALTGCVGFEPVPALSADIPAADWSEREIRDRFGVSFDGIPETRPLLPPGDPAALRRSSATEVSTVLYGPIRSGIVESARWVIETAGEDFIAVFPQMFFKKRGLEERFVDVDLELAPYVAEHVSGATAASHATAFARAVECALGVEIPERARAARTILLEFERVHQHLDSLGKLADDGSLAVGAAQTFAAKERVHRLLAEATGNRFSRGVVAVGGTRGDVFGALHETCASRLGTVEREATSVVEGLFNTQSLLDRLIGAGRLSSEIVQRYGGVGPVARGSDIRCDARATADGFMLAPIGSAEALERDGDAFARARVRQREIRESFGLIRRALDAAPSGT
ncbi:MAG: NADH-quinone oxidoreductase subunit C, partial [Candidatus Eremiobacteraeota bacterium]|nr:NADH-quinone oxidoreductase subunit C [Candidatus Eremiobacteraeota bacterium]